MNRRDFFSALAALACSSSACTSGTGKKISSLCTNENIGAPLSSNGMAGSSVSKPNVLFICIDDLNDWVGFLGGHPQVKTPNMDKLAAKTLVFEKAYCNAPLCGPSRASALTGLFPHTTGVSDNSTHIPSCLVTLPQHFTDNGYNTTLLGKIYHWWNQLPNFPLPETYPAANQKCSGYPNLPPNGLFDWAPVAVSDSEMPDGIYTTQAAEILSQEHTAPFFLGVGYLRTHVPWYVPQKYFDMYPLDQIVIPDVLANDWDDLSPTATSIARFLNDHQCIVSQDIWANAVQGYLASISFVDAQVGLLIDSLEKSKYADNTVVVLWSDNGFHLGEKFHWHKFSLWDESVRVPFLLSSPGTTPAIARQNVSLIDIFPTLIELCGLKTIDGLEGRSLVPLLSDPNMSWDYPVLTEYLNHKAIRKGEWCYIRYEDGEEELYNQNNDQNEWNNLAGLPEFDYMKAELSQYLPTV